MWHLAFPCQAKRANTQLKPGGSETLQEEGVGGGGGDIYQQWISVEKEKALGFIQQDLTFGVHQQQLFFFTDSKDRRGELA